MSSTKPTVSSTHYPGLLITHCLCFLANLKSGEKHSWNGLNKTCRIMLRMITVPGTGCSCLNISCEGPLKKITELSLQSALLWESHQLHSGTSPASCDNIKLVFHLCDAPNGSRWDHHVCESLWVCYAQQATRGNNNPSCTCIIKDSWK